MHVSDDFIEIFWYFHAVYTVEFSLKIAEPGILEVACIYSARDGGIPRTPFCIGRRLVRTR